MTFRTRLVPLPAMALLAFFAYPGVASPQDAAHLKGLTAVVVHVNPIVSPTGTIDVFMTQLEAEIQQRLRQAGSLSSRVKRPGRLARKGISGRTS